MHISSGSFSSGFFSSAGLGGGLDGLAGRGALSKLGGLDQGLLSGGFGQLDQFGGVGGLGGDLVKTLLAASGFKMLGDMARLLSMAGQNGAVNGAQQKGRCGGGGNQDPMSQNRVDGGAQASGGDSGAPKDSAMAKLGPNATFEDLVEAFMTDEVKKFREEIKGEMRKLQQSNGAGKGGGAGGKGGAGGGQKAGGAGGQQGRLNQIEDKGDSRQDMMEAVKNLMNKLQQMQQAMSNVLNTMHQGAMNSVRAIRGN